MDTVVRAAAVYVLLLIIIRISGRRTLAEMSSFDFVLLLIISECTQQALVADDYSLTTAFLAILTLIGLDIVLSLLKQKSRLADKLLEGAPTVLIQDGRLLHDRMRKARIDEIDIVHAARDKQGLESLDDVKYAVLETAGGISIIPKREK